MIMSAWAACALVFPIVTGVFSASAKACQHMRDVASNAGIDLSDDLEPVTGLYVEHSAIKVRACGVVQHAVHSAEFSLTATANALHHPILFKFILL
jgi:hypothetical protein